MANLEENIKSFVRDQGVSIVGVAGPERMDGPPSLNPRYTLKRAKSVVTFAIPMDVAAIYDFLGKKSPAPHNIDQLKMNQRVNRIGQNIAEYLESLGHKASMVPANTSYRRSLNPVFIHPSFSHRNAAIVSGIGAMGLSGNIMTEEHGASVYLGSVVTDAVLKSDPMLPPRYFMDGECKNCKLCAQACASRMFIAEEEEHVLIAGELYPRGKRRNINLCMATCFGMHSLSPDKKWTTWGKHWIKNWIGDQMDPGNKRQILMDFGKTAAMAGDSGKRYEIISNSSCELYPEELEDKIPAYKDLPEDEMERNKIMSEAAEKYLKVEGLADPNVLTCGQCSLVCGPTFDERAKRLDLLHESGLVVPGPEGRMVNCNTYEEACEVKKKYPLRASKKERAADQKHLRSLYTKRYLGIEPGSLWQNFTYQRKLKKAAGKQGVTPG